MSRKVSRRVVRTGLQSRSSDLTSELQSSVRSDEVLELFAVGDVYVSLCKKKRLRSNLARGEGRERYFGCNLMQRKVLASSHQYLMAEAPADSKGV